MVPHPSFEYLTTTEIKQFLGVIDDPRDRAIVILFLSTGLFLKEVIALQVSDIHWTKRTLTVTGKRHRELPLNDETYNALAEWNSRRPKTPVPYFFLTEKSKVKELSERGLDHLLRRYGIEAGFQKSISAQVLRGSFAVRLFEQGLSLKEASQILGITDFESLKKYQLAAHPSHSVDSETPTEKLEHLDTRSTTTKLIAKLFPKDIPTEQSPSVTPLALETDTLFGRDVLLKEITQRLKQGQSVLLTGPLGIGKTHILEHIAKHQDDAVMIKTPTPFKHLLTDLCDKALPSWKTKLGTRASIPDLMDYIQHTPLLCPPLVVIDHLERLKRSDAESLVLLMKRFTVLGATDVLDTRLQLVWWKFKAMPVPPLDKRAMKAMIAYLAQPLSVTDYDMMENRLIAQSNGYPLAIVDMMTHLCHQRRVTPESIREMSHDVGIRYRDWTNSLIIFWAMLVGFRFIALGTHSFEGYILAGFGTEFSSAPFSAHYPPTSITPKPSLAAFSFSFQNPSIAVLVIVQSLIHSSAGSSQQAFLHSAYRCSGGFTNTSPQPRLAPRSIYRSTRRGIALSRWA